MVVESKLSCRQPLGPIILEVVHICLEIHLDLLIHLLSLSISLWVESHTQICFFPNHGIELLHEPGDKLGALIAHNFVWDSMVAEHPVLQDLCHTKSSQVNPNPFDQHLLHELVNNNQDGIMST